MLITYLLKIGSCFCVLCQLKFYQKRYILINKGLSCCDCLKNNSGNQKSSERRARFLPKRFGCLPVLCGEVLLLVGIPEPHGYGRLGSVTGKIGSGKSENSVD